MGSNGRANCNVIIIIRSLGRFAPQEDEKMWRRAAKKRKARYSPDGSSEVLTHELADQIYRGGSFSSSLSITMGEKTGDVFDPCVFVADNAAAADLRGEKRERGWVLGMCGDIAPKSRLILGRHMPDVW